MKISRNTYCDNRTSINLDGKEINGRMLGYAIIFQLYNKNSSKGLRGIEYPTGKFLTDIKLKLYKAENGANVDITNEVNPILWQYYVAGTGARENAGVIPGREIYKENSGYVYAGMHLTPYGYLTENRDNCIFDSGTPSMNQDGNIIHMSIKDYKFDSIFPRVTRDGKENTATNYPSNVGCFSSIQFQIFVPDFDNYDNTGSYYLSVTDENMQSTSLSNVASNIQNCITDDSTIAQYTQRKAGSYSSYLHLVKRKGNNLWITYCSSAWGAGEEMRYYNRNSIQTSNTNGYEIPKEPRMQVKKIENKEDYIDLLLEADPSKDMIHKYLNDSDVYALKKEDELISIAVILHIDRKTLELKNIVTKENYRNKGYAKTLLKSLCGNYKQKYDRMLVGTTENNIPFYVKQGFDKYEKTIKNFFIDNYKEEIKDGELTCTDLIYYSKDLKKK